MPGLLQLDYLAPEQDGVLLPLFLLDLGVDLIVLHTFKGVQTDLRVVGLLGGLLQVSSCEAALHYAMLVLLLLEGIQHQRAIGPRTRCVGA